MRTSRNGRAKALLAATLLATGGAGATHPARAADLVPVASVTPLVPARNSVMLFAGALSTTDIYSTAILNLNKLSRSHLYDNAIVGGAYARDVVDVGAGFRVGVEFGIADRFGTHRRCCDVIETSSGLVHSVEGWAGVQVRHEGVVLFDSIRVGGGVTFGLSAAAAPIGREREREIEFGGDTRLLYYLGPELFVSSASMPNLEVVFRLHHRSGGQNVGFLPTLGRMPDSYNANVVGVRWRF